MARPDRLSRPRPARHRKAIVRSDYRRRCTHVRPPRPAAPHRELPVRRSGCGAGAGCGRSCRPPRADGTRVVLIGGEAGSGKTRLVREFAAGGGRRRPGPLRSLRRRGPHPLRTVRRCARPARALPSTPTSCAPRSAGAAGSSRVCCPTCRTASASCRPPSTPIRTPSATGCTPRWPTCSSAIARRRPTLLVHRGRPLGRRPDAAAPAPARSRSAAPACCSWPPSATRRSRCPTRSRRPSPTCAATTPSGWSSAGSPARTVADFVQSAAGVDLAPELHGLAQTIRDLTDGNAFLVCELWRALDRDRCGGGHRRDGAADRLGGGAGEPGERARGRQPAAVPPGARHQRPAGAGGHGGGRVRARRRAPRRRSRRSPSCSPRSTKRSAAG